DIVNAVTGWGIGTDEITEIGDRSLALARLFNLREGIDADTDRLPGTVHRPHVSGVLSKMRLDEDGVHEQIQDYYRARGWDDAGVPTSETLERLGITEYARN
ncbi:MAG: aldehyde ferredoxin oxidoreductase, partial [Chloroflexi bacterium]|nr:aldehyde ferredoxin oxidoreductase [Chloroflexota bacterium]